MSTLRKLTIGFGVAIMMAALPRAASAQNCSSMNPADWPAAAKPYFLLAVDTSGSMTTNVSGSALTTCTSGSGTNFGTDRRAHARCALQKTILAYSGQVNFGLVTYARLQSNCSNMDGPDADTLPDANEVCNFGSCTYSEPTGGLNTGCGAEPSPNGDSSTRAGGMFRVAMQQDIGSPASNVNNLLAWVDGGCADSREIFANGNTPMNGILRDAFRYYSNQWVPPSPNPGGATLSSPLTSLANGERACRSLNVILLTDGDETCDTQANAVDAAADLYNGFTKDGITWSVRTHVINFAGGNQANTDDIADAGDDGNSANNSAVSYLATNETTLALALSEIIAGSIQPETCDNVDNNCNTCVDEGYVHYCNTQQTCCVWANPTERQNCLDDFTDSLNSNPPDGDPSLLPCTTPGQQSVPAEWLCFNPGDECDNVDNNCVAGIDEGSTKCGMPAHCPLVETCNNQDDDCDGINDNGGVCGTCTPSPEVCDGCDNDCDGVTDDGIPAVPCGLTTPANCAGTLSCSPPQNVAPGGCAPGGGFSTCSNNPQTEICDTVDNDCDGLVDDGVAPSQCVPGGTPPGLIYGGTSQCVLGVQPCGGTCTGFVGPSAEICDGIDNDCDGVVDDNPFGVGAQCGVNFAPCTPGVIACVSGALVCQGGNPPDPEICDGVDNDCDGLTDESPLADAPGPGLNGCWDNPGNCCSHAGLSWCPPPGGTCNGVGTLTTPCNTGTLVCGGAQGWQCQGGTEPVPEVCDGVDNDCDGVPDDGNFPTEGQACGFSTPPCQQGVIQCTAGVLDCVGDTPPQPEVCNGIDDNCDTFIDNGIPVGGACIPTYDTALYPGDRSAPPCMPGQFQCDGMGGLVCTGGVGPSPEVCDGIDNDCDGTPDEAGPAPDGLDGTDNPFPPPDATLGDACGTDEGTCNEGQWACVNGLFACVNGQGPQPEQCDCSDNDCNGEIDNPNPGNNPPLCGGDQDCVQAGGVCQCAEPCDGGEFPCPSGQKCVDVVSSQTGEKLGGYCLADTCNDCETKTVTDADGDILCGPAGTTGPDCQDIPVCECKGQNGCRPPCFGVTCDTPLVCTNFGPAAGQCVVDNCFNIGCAGCGTVCTDSGECAANPCSEDSCPPDQVCKPSDDFSSFTCVGSCADVRCPSDTVCVDGECAPTCAPPCSAGDFCNMEVDPPTCQENLCTPDSCTSGGCCDPATGTCGSCPCEGVICPEGQVCQDDECVLDTTGEGGSGAGGNGSNEGGNQGEGAGSSQDGGSSANGGPVDDRVWGLATGGGGCACQTGATSDGKPGALAALLLGLALSRRRRLGRAEKEVVR